MVGVVANICCQSDGCEKIIGHQSLFQSCVTLLHTTDDVPTLVESFRFLKLLLWHLTHRVDPQDRSRCPVVSILKNHESLKDALIFMLKNSLSGKCYTIILLRYVHNILWYTSLFVCHFVLQYSMSICVTKCNLPVLIHYIHMTKPTQFAFTLDLFNLQPLSKLSKRIPILQC